MRRIIYIGQPGCNACLAMFSTTIAPLYELYPNNVSVHFMWGTEVERVNRRKTITRVPLVVVENGEREEFRYSGSLTLEQLEGIIKCEREAITLEEVLDGEVG